MPPQQGQGLLDVFDGALNIGAQNTFLFRAPIWGEQAAL
jgi:hypothetical protein